MVKLTGKCAKSFQEYLLKNDLISPWEYSIFEKLSELVKITYVIDFFDSVGIFINIKSKYGQRKQKEVFQFTLKNYKSEFMDSRLLASKEAIKVANGIFNNRK